MNIDYYVEQLTTEYVLLQEILMNCYHWWVVIDKQQLSKLTVSCRHNWYPYSNEQRAVLISILNLFFFGH